MIATEDELKQTLARWVLAQNNGDFTAYRALYASKFTGVKRSGEREVQFDREGWMMDRGHMFEKPFTLEIKDLKTAFAPGVAMAHFVQTWQSSTYRDQGSKRLLLVRENGHLVISREEMLDSVTAASEPLVRIPFERATLATKTVESFALLVPGKAKIAWATDHPKYISNERAQRAVSNKALPEALRKHQELRYEVFDRDGTRCEARPRGFQLMVHIIPHFGTIEFWEGRVRSEGESKEPVVNEERALALWRMGTGPFETEETFPGLTLGLEMEPQPNCPSPLWGRVMRDGAPTPWSVKPVAQEEMSKLVEAVFHHPLVGRYDREARADHTIPVEGRWSQGIRQGSARAIESAQGATFFFVEVDGAGGCASVTPAEVALLFRKQGDRLVPLDRALSPDGPINGAVDLDGDGEVELISQTGVLTLRGRGYTHIVDFSPLNLECPC